MGTYVDRLAGRSDVRFERDVRSVTAAELAAVESRSIRGGVVVAVRDDDGAVLLVRNEWMDGYGLPGGGVEPDEPWEAAARRELREETGVRATALRPWRVRDQFYEVGGDRHEGGYTVFYLARPVDGDDIAGTPGVGDEEIHDVGWFSAVPPNAFQPDLLRELLGEGNSPALEQ